jgi:hypothetical protein
MSILTYFYDSSDIGCIDEYILERYHKNDKLHSVKLRTYKNTILNLIKYKSAFPIIVNHIKYFFGVSEINTVIVTIDNVKYIGYENENSVPLSEYTGDKFFLKNNIRDLIAFNHIMNINSNYEKNIFLFPVSTEPYTVNTRKSCLVIPVFINEKSFKLNSDDNQISKPILDKWFDGSMEVFENCVRKMVNSVDHNSVRFRMKEIVNKYDSNYLTWLNVVYENLQKYQD